MRSARWARTSLIIHPLTATVALGAAVLGTSLPPAEIVWVVATALLAEVLSKGLTFGWTGEELDDDGDPDPA